LVSETAIPFKVANIKDLKQGLKKNEKLAADLEELWSEKRPYSEYEKVIEEVEKLPFSSEEGDKLLQMKEDYNFVQQLRNLKEDESHFVSDYKMASEIKDTLLCECEGLDEIVEAYEKDREAFDALKREFDN